MRKFVTITLSSMFLFWSSLVYSGEYVVGFGIPVGQVETSGTETEGNATDTSTRNKSVKETFVGADLYVEYVMDNGYSVGLSYIPFDIELGSGSRTDSSTGADVASEADTGTRTASADLTDFMTLYANVPMGAGGWYGLVGMHFATIETSETLPNSSYPNEDIFGYQIGLGNKSGTFKYELAYSDFEDIDISATGGNAGNSITADADVLQFRIAYGF